VWQSLRLPGLVTKAGLWQPGDVPVASRSMSSVASRPVHADVESPADPGFVAVSPRLIIVTSPPRASGSGT
jgi:hypothetical protein